uniref:Vacuolar protein-sorting-associated protein 36 n=1 Tax=Xenopsylla cheopis TaxID=163159 RepID=A0A6M2DTY1_XENCH
MDRLEYNVAKLNEGESFVVREKNIRLYDGDVKTNFEGGEVVLTSRRLFWGRPGEIPKGQTCITLPLQLVKSVEEASSGVFGFSRSKKIILYLHPASPNKMPGPSASSLYDFIKLSFREGYSSEFIQSLNATLEAKEWCVLENSSTEPQVKKLPNIKTRTGIVGIERSLEEKQKATNANINQAFQDLSKLMAMAKDMVNISKSISQKIRDRQGDITQDETVRFKSYLLSLGIDDPVTRDAYQSDSQYFKKLANQLNEILVQPIEEVGGMMSLSDVFVRVNRARGLELLSPEDLLSACRLLEPPLMLRQFPSGAMVLQLESHSDISVIESTLEALEQNGFLTPQLLSESLGIPILLAHERLLTTELAGKACRDESIEGLRFYPNLFLKNME